MPQKHVLDAVLRAARRLPGYPSLRVLDLSAGRGEIAAPLPYPDAAFDLVILCEVAEHLPSSIPVIAEIGRVLTPGGHLILSTPNIARLHSRCHFFWAGT